MTHMTMISIVLSYFLIWIVNSCPINLINDLMS